MTKHIAAKISIAVLALLLIAFAVNVVLLVFASILLAIALRALAEPVAKRIGISEPWSVAAPATAPLLVLVRMVYLEDTLGQRPTATAGPIRPARAQGIVNGTMLAFTCCTTR